MKNCIIDNTIHLLSKKWTLLIIKELCEKKKLRYNELRSNLSGISPKTLTERLRELENEGLVKREVFAEVPTRVEYSLTEKGLEMAASLKSIISWAKKWDAMGYKAMGVQR
jgi:DNA-binding HxlR family transcriptional regulator